MTSCINFYRCNVDGKTLLVFSRKLSTGDSNDHVLFTDTIKRQTFICAHGADNDDVAANYAYHSSGKRAKYSLDINTAEKISHSTWTAAKLAQTSIKYIDLRADGLANSCDNCAASKSGDSDYQGPTVGGYAVPADKTTYTEFCYPLALNSGWDRNTHMVAFEGLTDPDERTTSPNNIHHNVLYAYTSDNCDSGGTASVIWVGGVTFYEDLPTNVGISFNRFQSFKVQTHYDNPAGTTGLLDNSGIRVYLDSVAPTHDAGTLQLGDGTLELSRSDGNGGQKAVIPSGRSFWTFGCPATFTNSWPIDSVTVFGSILHMHKMGDMMYTEINKADGSPAKRVNSVQFFDFDHQDPTLVVPYTISKGDSMKTRCYFDNTKPDNTPLYFGKSSDEEMCIDFLYYYPYNAGIKDHCTMPTGAAGYSGHFGGTYDGTQTITEASDAGMRVFGVSVGTEDAATCTGGATVEWSKPSTPTTNDAAPSPTTKKVAAPSPTTKKIAAPSPTTKKIAAPSPTTKKIAADTPSSVDVDGTGVSNDAASKHSRATLAVVAMLMAVSVSTVIFA